MKITISFTSFTVTHFYVLIQCLVDKQDAITMENAVERIPRDLRNLRACLLCSLVKSFEQFEMDGCDNCDHFLGMAHNRDVVYDATSSNFDGLTAVTTPDESWSAKWLKVQHFKPGIYAISVSGTPSEAILYLLKKRNIPYRSRDRSN